MILVCGSCSFTIIAPGPSDIDQDGPALVGDPDMGFAGLRQFGPTLVHHAQLKVRLHIALRNVMYDRSTYRVFVPPARTEGSCIVFSPHSENGQVASILCPKLHFL